MKVLVVDDVGYARHFHARLLQKQGHSAVSAGSGVEALRMLQTDHSIDVVLTDLGMSDIDGIELYQQTQRLQRMNDQGPVAPPLFVLMTALHPGKNAQPRDIERLRIAKEVGFADVLFKPIEAEQLVAALERVKRSGGKKKVDTAAMIQQVNSLVANLLGSGTADDFNEFLDGIEPALMQVRDATLIAATA
jgi:CheY-like chemotaxis protein